MLVPLRSSLLRDGILASARIVIVALLLATAAQPHRVVSTGALPPPPSPAPPPLSAPPPRRPSEEGEEGEERIKYALETALDILASPSPWPVAQDLLTFGTDASAGEDKGPHPRLAQRR